MKIIILGSGGFRTIPQPWCQCKICKQARKDPVFARTGPSFYLEDAGVLVDMPCESKLQLDRLKHPPKNIVFSHWHPDHTEGCRALEAFPNQPAVWIPPRSKLFQRMPAFEFLRAAGKIVFKTWGRKPIMAGNYRLSYLLINKEIPVYAFLLTGQRKKILICPDHSRFLLSVETIPGLDLLIMNMGALKTDKPGITKFSDNLEIIEKFSPKKTILVHIEEHFGIDCRKQKQIEQKYRAKNLIIAHDFQRILV